MKTLAPFGLALVVWGMAAAQDASAQDAASGAKLFARTCQACHTLDPGKHKVGPSLAGVVGREAGSAEGYRYSNAMKESGVVWNEETLAQYLANPRTFIPGNKMTFAGVKDEAQVRDIIAHIEEGAK